MSQAGIISNSSGSLPILTITGNTGGSQSPSSGNFNIVGAGSITVTGSPNTETVQLTGLTNHALQVGAGTAMLTQLSSGTTGQVLQTNTNADPTWSTAIFPSSTTVNQILYSSSSNVIGEIPSTNNGTLITSAGGVPSILSNGTTGQVLTATTGSPPTWAAIPSSFSPNSTLNAFDDFIGVIQTGGELYSQMSWMISASTWTTTSITADSQHPGLISNASISGATSNNSIVASNGTSNPGNIILGGGTIVLTWIFKINTLSNSTNRYNILMGLSDSYGGNTTPTNGCYILYSDNLNSGSWEFVTSNASTRTISTSSVAATIGWHNFQMTINSVGTSVSYNMDGVSLGTAITTNIPISKIAPIFSLQATATGTVAADSINVDLFSIIQTLTNPR